MKKILFLLCFCTSLSLIGQVPVFEWATQLGDARSDYINEMATDSLGNIYITGSFRDTVDFDPSSNIHILTSKGGTRDIFVAKYDQSGNFLWAHSFGGFDEEYGDSGLGVTIDDTGNVYVTGIYAGNVDFDPSSSGTHFLASNDEDIFAVKLTTNGDFIWAKNMGGGGNEGGDYIITDEEGSVYILGTFSSMVDFDPSDQEYNLTPNGNRDIFIIKLNNDGDFVWTKLISGGASGLVSGIFIDELSNIYTVGYFNSMVDFDPGPNQFNLMAIGEFDLFILKLNSDGDFEWAKNVGASLSNTYGFDITIDEVGDIYTTGRFESIVDFDPGPNQFNLTTIGESDVFILKINSDGNFVWVRTFGGEGLDTGSALTVDGNNNIYITGSFEDTVTLDLGLDTVYLLSAEESNGYIVKLDSMGAFIWAGSFTGNDRTFGKSIAVDNWDNIYTAGHFWSTADFDPDSTSYELTSNGSTDIFIQKMSQQPCTASPIITSPNTSFTICQGESIALSAELPTDVFGFSYSWNSGQTSDSIVVTPVTTSTYTVHVSYSPSCNDSVSLEVTVFENVDTIYLSFTTCDSLIADTTEFTYSDQNGCDSIVIETTTFIPFPEMPVAPADLIIQENAPSFQLTTPEDPNATSYSWQVPPGVQILSGANTNTITINWDDQIPSGTVCVTALNECGSSSADCMEITVDFTDGLEKIKTKAYSIFPNPARDFLTIVFEEEEPYELVLLDALGRIVLPPATYSVQTKIETKELAPGTYWVKISKGGEAFWERVEILR